VATFHRASPGEKPKKTPAAVDGYKGMHWDLQKEKQNAYVCRCCWNNIREKRPWAQQLRASPMGFGGSSSASSPSKWSWAQKDGPGANSVWGLVHFS